ncbi:hypothetical protein D3C76_1329370 [compost metagenome]
MPKSSTAMLRPRFFRPARICSASFTSRIRILSVNSSSRHAGGRPLSSRMLAIRVPSWPSENCRAEMFTDTFGTRTLALCQALSWRLASRSTQSPTSTTRPSSSITGMKSPGGTRPRVGWRQRSRASAPVRRLPSPLNCGW